MSDDDSPAERARTLREAALDNPEAVDLDDLHEILTEPAAPPNAHGMAIVALLQVTFSDVSPGSRFVPPLAKLLTRPSLDADAVVLRCLRQLALDHPDAVLEHVDAIADRVTLDGGDVTKAATGCCTILVEDERAVFIDLAPTLSALLESEDAAIRRNAMYVLSQIAREYPDEVRPLVPQLVTDVTSRDSNYLKNLLSTLGHVTDAYPDAARPVLEELAHLSEDSDQAVRGNAIGLIADVAKQHPSDVAPYVETLEARLEDDEAIVRGNAASGVLHVAVENPDAVETAIPALVEILDDPDPSVRRATCKALAHLEATVAQEQLRSLAESDPEPSVREVAGWAVERLSK